MFQDQEYLGDSLHSPIHRQQTGNMPEPLHQDITVDGESNTSFNTWSQNSHKKNCVRFSPLEETKTNSYQPTWNHSSEEEIEKHYLSSGLNSQAELEILYAARGTEISKLMSEINHLHHKVALLGIVTCFSTNNACSFVGFFLYCRWGKDRNENDIRNQ